MATPRKPERDVRVSVLIFEYRALYHDMRPHPAVVLTLHTAQSHNAWSFNRTSVFFNRMNMDASNVRSPGRGFPQIKTATSRPGRAAPVSQFSRFIDPNLMRSSAHQFNAISSMRMSMKQRQFQDSQRVKQKVPRPRVAAREESAAPRKAFKLTGKLAARTTARSNDSKQSYLAQYVVISSVDVLLTHGSGDTFVDLHKRNFHRTEDKSKFLAQQGFQLNSSRGT